MIVRLPEDLLKTIQQYCHKRDWKCLMDTSNELLRELKYRTIHVKVSFDELNDRVLPPIVAKLKNPSQQLHLYLNSENSITDDDFRARRSWRSRDKWRSTDRITRKDIKWFLSIPAQSLDWYGAGPLLENDTLLMKALRKYEDIKLHIHPIFILPVDCKPLNNCKRIQFLSIAHSSNFQLPKLPSLRELIVSNSFFCDENEEIDLTNLNDSLSLRKVILDMSVGNVVIPKQLKERGVIINCIRIFSNLKIIELGREKIDDENDNDDNKYVHHQDNNDAEEEDDNFNIYDEDEITVYGKEEDEINKFYY